MLGRADVERQRVDDLFGDLLAELIAQQRQDHLVAGEQDRRDAFVADEPGERIRHLLRMLQVVVVDVALIARLRPAAHLVPAGLGSLDCGGLLDSVRRDDEQPRLAGVGDQHDEPGIAIDQMRERIEVRLIRNVQTVPIDGRGERHRFEQVGA